MHPYASGVIDKIKLAIDHQEEKINELAQILADNVEQGGILHVLGSGHSHMIAEEIFYRAGGPVFVNPILEPGLMLHNGTRKSTRVERLLGYAEVILKDVDLDEKDVFLVISNSGRNILPIEAALYAKEKGLFTASISSFSHSKSVESRHHNGKRLFEITDLSLDNYGEIGDAQLETKGMDGKYGPTSSVVGIVLVQVLISKTIENLIQKGISPPLFRSANLDGSDKKNKENIEKYIKRIPLLR